ncbi:MFS antiporter QDR2 [Choanephora cucurbitarum]|uniref:MFS antiporter QDR2 n=1 Tax=Choanephora cucurbitarum TaxID=101091 RepID=A0A1C7MXM7_9FUNG|nr:MFS antiporter QDR2 [Choanephora cucurbitarum]
MQEKTVDTNANGSRIRSYFRERMALKPPVLEDPRLLDPKIKSGIVACISLVACTGGFSSTIYFPGIPYVTADLNAPPIATTLTAALFILFMGIMPVVWASISEHFHVRRIIFLVAMVIYSASSLGAAFVQNIWVLVVLRCIQSMGVSSGQSVGSGYISDLYPIEQRGAAFGKYMFGAVFGPLLGPILGGLLTMSSMGWRATFWFCFSFGIFIFIITFLFTPETFRDEAKFEQQLPIFEKDSNSQLSTRTTVSDVPDTKTIDNNDIDKEVLPKKRFNPFKPFGLLRHPFIFMVALTGGFFFGAMFATETILPSAFEKTYGLNSWQTGLCYLGAGIGNICGTFVGGRLSDRLLLRSRRLRGGIPRCEDRLTANIWAAGLFCVPLGCLIFGWVVEYKLSFWGAIVGFGIQCFGNMQVMSTCTAYLVDAVPGRGSSVTAATGFVRMTLSCVLTVVATPMVQALGAGWTCTLFACLSWVGMLLLFILKIYGEPIRSWSGF